MAGSKYTFEAWMNFEFMLVGQQSKFADEKIISKISSCHPREIPKYQLSKIRNEQKRIGRKFIEIFLEKQKKKFYSTFKKSSVKLEYKETVLDEIRWIFQHPIEKKITKFIIPSLDLELSGQVTRDIYEFYKDNYELGKNMKFEYISPEHPQHKRYRITAPLLTIALHELMEWVKNFEVKRLDIVTKASKKDNFKVALSFAKGDIYKWYKSTNSFMKCAEKLNAPNARPWLSESFRADSTSDKNIFNHPNLIREVIDYCYFNSIKLDSRFITRSVRAKIDMH